MSLYIDGAERWSRAQRAAVVAAVRRTARAAKLGDLAVGLAFVDDREMRALNRAWRGKDRPTDVLSFAAHEEGGDGVGMAGLERELGDVVISVDTAARQAHRLGHPVAQEVAVLFAHGLLHLCGLDHEASAAEARAMAELELSFLDAAGYPCALALIGRSFD